LEKYAKNVTNALARDIQMVGQKKREIMNLSQQKFDFSSPELIPGMLEKAYGEADSGRTILRTAWLVARACWYAPLVIALMSRTIPT
jgi:hypothetical protein